MVNDFVNSPPGCRPPVRDDSAALPAVRQGAWSSRVCRYCWYDSSPALSAAAACVLAALFDALELIRAPPIEPATTAAATMSFSDPFAVIGFHRLGADALEQVAGVGLDLRTHEPALHAAAA